MGNKTQIKNCLLFLAIAFIWGVLVLPSCFYPCWGYLDDPTILFNAKILATKYHFPRPDGASGRYFPAYWLYFAVLYKIFKFNLIGYYFIQALMFFLVLLLGFAITKKATRSSYYGVFAVFLIATASPVAENFYTLGKGEPKILFYFLCALWVSLILLFDNHVKARRWRRRLNFFLIFFLLFVAILTKETAMVFLVFSSSGLFIILLLKNKDGFEKKQKIKLFFKLTVISAGAIGLARGFFFLLKPQNSFSVYTSYPINLNIVLYNLKFYLLQQPDVLLLCIISVLLLGAIFAQGKACLNHCFLVASSLLFTALAYILVQLVWRWPFGYYMLVPAVLLSISFVIALQVVHQSAKSKKLAFFCLGLVLLTRGYTIPYFTYIACAQKAQDQLYTEVVEYYTANAHSGERLLVEDWPFFVEPVGQTNILIKNILQKEGLQVEGVQDILQKMSFSKETLKLFNIDKMPDRNSRVPNINDYILAFNGNRSTSWILRGVCPFLKEAGSAFKKTGIEVDEVASNEVRWKSLGLSTKKLPIIQTSSAGYTLYKVKDPLPKIFWDGRWADNWIGSMARCTLRVQGRKNEFVFHGFAIDKNIPLVLTIMKDKTVLREVEINQSGPFDIVIGIFSSADGGLVDIQLYIDKTFNPKKLGINDDDRDLGIIVEVERSCASSPR